MEQSDFDPKELTQEKNLWDIYKESRKIPHSSFNRNTTVLVLILVILESFFTSQPISETTNFVRELSQMGLAITLSTLGFLLAGYTIFSTVTNPRLSLQMAGIDHKESGLSYIKHNNFIFLRVFIYYLAFAIFCLFIVLMGHHGGLVPLIVSLAPNPEIVKILLVKTAYVLMFTGYYFLLMQLKSFIFNIYHSVMTSLRWTAENSDGS